MGSNPLIEKYGNQNVQSDNPLIAKYGSQQPEQGFIGKATSAVVNNLSTEKNPEQDPEAKAMLQTFGYLSGLGSTGAIQAARYISGNNAKDQSKSGLDEIKSALQGMATPATNQLQKYFGLSPNAADAVSLPVTALTDPLASMFSVNPEASLANTAENLTIKHLRPTPKLAQSLGPQRLKDIARESLDSGSVKFGNRAEDTATALSNAKENVGASIGDILDNANGKVDPKSIANEIDNQVIAPLKQTAANRGAAAVIENEKNAFLNQYGANDSNMSQMTAPQLEMEKRAVQNNINYITDPKAKQQAMMDYASLLRKKSEELINNPEFIPNKRAYGNLSSAEQMASRTAGLTNGGTGLTGSLADLGVNLEALQELANGNPAGIPLVAARAMTKGRMASSGAVTADSLAKLSRQIKNLGIHPQAVLRQDAINNQNPWEQIQGQ